MPTSAAMEAAPGTGNPAAAPVVGVDVAEPVDPGAFGIGVLLTAEPVLSVVVEPVAAVSVPVVEALRVVAAAAL